MELRHLRYFVAVGEEQHRAGVEGRLMVEVLPGSRHDDLPECFVEASRPWRSSSAPCS